MNKSRLYKASLEEIQRNGANIVAWAANNRGNGSKNLHVAELERGVARAPTFRQQRGVIRHGFTSHWAGQCSVSRILAAINQYTGTFNEDRKG